MFTISELYIYPIKSLGGISVPSALLTDRGFKYDRQWMLVNENNQFFTQREIPEMALLSVEIGTNDIIIRHSLHKYPPLEVPLIPPGNEMVPVKIWSDHCKAIRVGTTADEWFSNALALKCRLVYMPEESKRLVDERYAHNKELTMFTDGYPLMMLGQASLDDLNSRLDMPLPIDRFRPNIVFTGGQPFEEDTMKHFNIGNIEFYAAKLCERCMITTINQQTAARNKEPLATLSNYRKINNHVYFGQNLLFRGEGNIKIGDLIEI